MRINVLIASPMDVADVREAVQRVFTRWNDVNDPTSLHPVRWESAAVPAMGDHPQHLLDRQLIDRCDLLIAILWSRLGTPTPTERSGTLEEIREFIKAKGPARVMVYFCNRPVPHNIDLIEFTRLRDFKDEMKTCGLFHEFAKVEEFETELYRHLDVKVADLNSGRLPLPTNDPAKSKSASDACSARPGKQPVDARLRQPIDFGTTLTSIVAAFSARMDEFQKLDGAGPDKFLDLGAHVYNSCADCLDRFLSRSGARVSAQDSAGVDRIIARLRRLADTSADYVKAFPEFWQGGKEIADDLALRVNRMKHAPAGAASR